MKFILSASSLLALLGLTACAATSQPPPLQTTPVQSVPAVFGETCLPFTGVAAEVATARTRFNNAIADADLTTIAALLKQNTILITGTDSAVFNGRDAQLAIWTEDFASPETRLVYARAPACITLSTVAPIAMERGHWRGAATEATLNSVGGEYSAKWRKVDGKWVIEVETYATTHCTGTLCPANPELAQEATKENPAP